MSKTLVAIAAALITASGVAAGGLPTAALAQNGSNPAPTVADPNRLFTDSTLIVRDRISVEVTGKGPDLILVPGLNSSRQTWKHTAERLRGRYRLHLVQVAGFSGEPARGNATGRVLAPTAEAIDAYIVDAHLAPVVYIGHSLGGTMGIYLAQHHPEHLKKVLLVDSLPFFGVLMGGPSATADSVRPMAQQMEAAMSAAPAGGAPPAMLASMVKDPDGLKVVVAWSAASDPKVGAKAMADDVVLDMRSGLPTTQTPITLIYPFDPSLGAPAAQIDATYQSQFAPLPHKTLVRVDDSRHFVMLDQPARFDAALDVFLAG